MMQVPEDAPIGTVVHILTAIDPDISTSEALDYAATEPITVVDKDGKEVFLKNTIIFFSDCNENIFYLFSD